MRELKKRVYLSSKKMVKGVINGEEVLMVPFFSKFEAPKYSEEYIDELSVEEQYSTVTVGKLGGFIKVTGELIGQVNKVLSNKKEVCCEITGELLDRKECPVLKSTQCLLGLKEIKEVK